MRLVVQARSASRHASPAFAQRGPEIVIPGKPGVPVYINGVDASWSVVEGEFGLDRPGQVTPTISFGRCGFDALQFRPIPDIKPRPDTAASKWYRRRIVRCRRRPRATFAGGRAIRVRSGYVCAVLRTKQWSRRIGRATHRRVQVQVLRRNQGPPRSLTRVKLSHRQAGGWSVSIRLLRGAVL